MSAFDYGIRGWSSASPDEIPGVATGVPYYYAVPGDAQQVGDLMHWGVGNGFYGAYNAPPMVMAVPMGAPMPVVAPGFEDVAFPYQYFGGAAPVAGVYEQMMPPSLEERGNGDFVQQRVGDEFSELESFSSFDDGVSERETGDAFNVRLGNGNGELDEEVLEREIRDFVMSRSGNGYDDEVGHFSSFNRADAVYGSYAGMPGQVPMGVDCFGNGYYGGFEAGSSVEEGVRVKESFREQIKGFMKATGELLQDLGRGCWDIGHQSLSGVEDTYVGKKARKHWAVASQWLGFLNEYLPEDRDPMLAWPVVICVFLVMLVALNVNSGHEAAVQKVMTLHGNYPSASLIQLPDGRNMSYYEQGVPAERARFSMIAPHSFLSSRLAGIPGIKNSLLEEFGVRLVSYDLPGFGESDPCPGRDLKSSALDILSLANELGITTRFWVLGYSAGSIHAWASAHYIPDRLAGVAMFAPLANPYDSSMNREERHKAWDKWTTKRKLLHVLARRFPSLLRYVYRRSFLSGKRGRLENWLSYSLGKKDKTLFEDRVFLEYQEKDMAESVRQGEPTSFVEESSLQVADWGFSLADIRAWKQQKGRGPFMWLKSFYSPVEGEWTGFLGPIHIWQGMDDYVVPPAMTEFVQRMVPGVTVHMLPDEGHFSYFCFCDDCHRQIFSTLFGTPQGPVLEQDLALAEDYIEESEVFSADNSTRLECVAAF